MIGVIHAINTDKTKAQIKWVQKLDDDNNAAISNWIKLTYLVFNDEMQLLTPYKIGDVVEVRDSKEGKRFISRMFKHVDIDRMASDNEYGMFFKGGNAIKYNTLTSEITINTSADVNIEANGACNVKGNNINVESLGMCSIKGNPINLN